MENLATLAVALPAPLPTYLLTLSLEIRHQIYESLIDLPCTIITGIDHSVPGASSLVKDGGRGNLGALSETCKKLRDEIYSWAPVLRNRGIVISETFGAIDPKLTTFRFNWSDAREVQTVEYPAPLTLAHVIDIFALLKDCMREDASLKSMFRQLQWRFKKGGKSVQTG